MKRNALVLLLAVALAISGVGIGFSAIDSAPGQSPEGGTTEDDPETVNITVCKFYDQEGTGEFDEEDGDYMIEDWFFQLDIFVEVPQPWEKLDNGTTDEDGCITFEVESGEHYRVREFLEEGWYFTGGNVTGGTADDDDFSVDNGEVDITFFDRGEDVELWLGNRERGEGDGEITAYKFHDMDSTGEYDEEVDEMLEDWTFNLWTTDEEGDPMMIIDTETTNEYGKAVFEDVAPGDYIVQEELKDGWYNTTDLLQPVTIEDDEEESLWFGNNEKEPGEITVYKFHDMDSTGEYDEEVDEMLEDWTFNLWTTDVEGDPEEIIDTQVTDEYGAAVFEDVAPGDYIVQEELKDGWYNTTDLLQPVTVEYDENELWFGNNEKEPGEITVWKYYDEHMDGEYRDGYEKLENWTFNLWTTDEEGDPDEIIDTQVTGENGAAYFDEVAPGDYIVQEELRDCWFNTTPLLQPVTVESGEESTLGFGNIPGGSIEGMKFMDVDADGEFDVGQDRPLENWEIRLWTVENGEPNEIIETTETDKYGEYSFDCVAPGEYYVQEEMPDGWYNVTPALQHVYVEPEETVEDIDFANMMTKDIYGIKFYDYNRTGEFNEGEDWVIEGWEINLWNEVEGEPGEIIDTTYTQSNGYYYFEDLEPGTYYVQEEEREGWDNTTPRLVKVEFDDCSPCKNVNFGNYEFPEIEINKFHDVSMTGEYEPEKGDYLLEDYPVDFDVMGVSNGVTVFDETLTVEGTYHTYVPVGDFNITEYLPEGWSNTTPLTLEQTLRPGDHWEAWFGNAQYGEITVWKYYDEHMDGEYRDGYEKLENWTFNLWTTDEEGDPDEIIDTQVTGENGAAYFDEVKPGDYIVQEELKEGWFNTTPILQPVTVESGEESTLGFGNAQYGEITVWKYYDEHMDGEYRDGYEKLENWTFNLWTTDEYGDPDEIIDTQVTGENGAAYFDEVVPGDYIVQEELRDCWFNTTPLLQPVTVEPGEESTLEFGNIPGGSIEGYKFCDRNMNQEFDDDEEGLEGWTINLYKDYGEEMPADHHEPYMTTTTDENGHYEFRCLEPGDYIIEEEMKDGWYNSTSYYYEVTVEPEDELRYDFGNYRYGDITGIKFYDFTMNGEFEPKEGDIPLRDREVQLWTADEEGNPIGEGPIETTETDEHGYYMFEDIGPGDYVVYQPEPCCDWVHTTPRQQHVRMGCVEEAEVHFGEYKYSNIDVYVECGTSGVEVMIYESDEYGEKHELLESGYTGEHGWYISEKLEPGYYLVKLEDGQYEHVQLRMGEQVEFESPEDDVDNMSLKELSVTKFRQTRLQ